MSEISTAFPVASVPVRAHHALRRHDLIIASALGFSALGAFGPLQYLHLLPLVAIVAALFGPLVTTHAMRLVMPRPVLMGAVLLSLGGIMSVFASADRRESVWQLIFAIIVPVVFYIGLGTRAWRTESVKFYVTAIAVACSIPLLTGLLAFYRAFGMPRDVTTLVWARFDMIRMASYQDVTYGNVLHTADLLLLILPPLVALAIEARGIVRYVAAAAVAIGAANMLVVAARGATFILIVSLAYLLWRVRNRHAIFIVAIGMCAWAYHEIDSTMVEPIWQRYEALAYGGDASAYERLQSMKTGIGLLRENLVSGVGLGNYYLVDPVYTAAHEMVIHVGVEAGILGLIGIALILGGAVVSAFRVLRQARATPVVIGCAIGLLAFTIQALTAGSNFAVVGVNIWGMLFWFFLRVCEESTLSSRPLVIRA